MPIISKNKRVDVILFDFGIEVGYMNTGIGGGAGHITFCGSQAIDEVLPLESLQCALLGLFEGKQVRMVGVTIASPQHPVGKMAAFDNTSVVKHHHAFYDIFELADIPGKIIGAEPCLCIGR